MKTKLESVRRGEKTHRPTASVSGTENMSEPKPIESETRGGSCAPAPGSANPRDEIIGPGWCDACGEYVEKLLVIKQRGIAGLCSCQKCAGSGWPNEDYETPVA